MWRKTEGHSLSSRSCMECPGLGPHDDLAELLSSLHTRQRVAPSLQRKRRIDDRREPPRDKLAYHGVNSASSPFVDPISVHWFQNNRRTSVSTIAPLVPPHVTRRPPRPSATSKCFHVAEPTQSSTTVTPRLFVRARTSRPTSTIL